MKVVQRWSDGTELMVGPHMGMLAVTYSIIITLSVIIFGVVLTEREEGERIAGLVLTLTVLAALTVLALKDPGVVPLSTEPLENEPSTFCDRCEGYRPIGAIHCNDCNVCIEEYDHHCPWSSKCIGKRNVHVFHAFLVLLFALMVRAIHRSPVLGFCIDFDPNRRVSPRSLIASLFRPNPPGTIPTLRCSME